MSVRPARRMDGVERTLIRRIFDSAPPDAINLGLGQPDLPTPARVRLAGIAGIAEGRTGYTPTAGTPALRAAVAERYRPFARGPESVVVTVGSQEALFASLLAVVDPGDEVLCPDPGFPAYPMMVRLVGGVAAPYPLRAERGFRLAASDVLSRLTGRTKAVVLCSPSNPTGAVAAAEELETLTAGLAARGVAWLSDEVYAGFAYRGPVPSPSQFSADGGVVVGGLSKDTSMTGWRIGWAVGPEEVVDRILAAHHYLVTCAPAMSQAAALAALAAGGEEERAGYLARFRARRDLMAAELARVPGIEFEPPDGAFYFFVNVSRHGDSLEICRRLLERRRVITIAGEAFGEGGRGFLRISFAAPEEDIVRGVRAIGSELSGV